jgi:HEAT repeat protein
LGNKKSDRILDVLKDEYVKTDDAKFKQNIIFAMSQNKNKKTVPTLIEMARQEKDPRLKKQIIFALGQSKDEEAINFLKEIIEK